MDSSGRSTLHRLPSRVTPKALFLPVARMFRGWWKGTGERGEGVWDSRQLAGRMASILIGASGASSLFSIARADAPGESPLGVLVVGLGAAVLGGIAWLIPWKRIPRRLILLFIPLGFLLISLRNYMGGNDPYLIPIFFVVAYTWIGVAEPRGTSLVVSPLMVAAYLGPLHASGIMTQQAWTSVLYTWVVCVLVSEMIAWMVDRLNATHEILRERQVEARFKALVQNASDVVTVVEPDGTVKYQTPSVNRMLGFDPVDLVGSRLTDIVHPTDVPHVEDFLARVQRGTEESSKAEWRLRSRSGEWVAVEATGANLAADPYVRGLVLTARDIRERKALEEQLTRQAFHDSLTGLANRALFGEHLDRALARADRYQVEVAILFIDLDDFKNVNDSMGHSAGDELLVLAARRLEDSLRAGDTAARLGGDEFAVLLEGDAQGLPAAEVAERVVQELSRPFDLGGNQVFVSASVGVATRAPGGPEDSDELRRNADLALYAAKAEGKERFRLFEPHMHEALQERLRMEVELRSALENQEIVAFYQPILSVKDGTIEAVEALARWHHPTKGLLLPEDFIGLAEETGMIVPLGLSVLEQACRCVVGWKHQGVTSDLRLTVNMSPRQLHHPNVVEDVLRVVNESGLDPAGLVLEITENVLMEDSAELQATVVALRNHGIRFSIDDFGTGYSSFGYLKRYPVDILKIPKAFVEGIDKGLEHSALAEAILSLGGSLSMEVVAEGIESKEQLQRLSALRCDMWQGFYHSRPDEADRVRELIVQNGLGGGATEQKAG